MCTTELLQSHFEEQGLLQRGTRGFEPHLTIMKLSRASNLRSQVLVRSVHQLDVSTSKPNLREGERRGMGGRVSSRGQVRQRKASVTAMTSCVLRGVCKTTFQCGMNLQTRMVFYFRFVSPRASGEWIQLSTLTTLTSRCPAFPFYSQKCITPRSELFCSRGFSISCCIKCSTLHCWALV